jgi:hypothetical protein
MEQHFERPLNELIILLTFNMAKWSSSKGTSMYYVIRWEEVVRKWQLSTESN